MDRSRSKIKRRWLGGPIRTRKPPLPPSLPPSFGRKQKHKTEADFNAYALGSLFVSSIVFISHKSFLSCGFFAPPTLPPSLPPPSPYTKGPNTLYMYFHISPLPYLILPPCSKVILV